MQPGTQLGHYEISDLLNNGGMGLLGVPDPKGTVGPRIRNGQLSETASPVPEEGCQR